MRFFLVLTALILSGSALATTFYLELKNWPAVLKPKIEQAANELTATDECWDVQDKVATHAPTLVDKECLQFKWFKSEKDLQPWKPLSTHRKLELTYAKGKEQLMLVRVFDWDGKKRRRVLNSSQTLKSEMNFKDSIVLWALK